MTPLVYDETDLITLPYAKYIVSEILGYFNITHIPKIIIHKNHNLDSKILATYYEETIDVYGRDNLTIGVVLHELSHHIQYYELLNKRYIKEVFELRHNLKFFTIEKKVFDICRKRFIMVIMNLDEDYRNMKSWNQVFSNEFRKYGMI